MNKKAGIIGIGSSVPKKVLTNFDLEKMVDTSDEWIRTRTGIKERRIAEAGEALSKFMTLAAEKAIKKAGIDPLQIDLIMCGTVTPDMPLPATAIYVQKNIGAHNAAALDLAAACSGFIYGLTIANEFVLSGKYKHVLVIGGEVLSKVMDWEDRATCVLFADGAGAAVVSSVEEPQGILASQIYSDGRYADLLMIPGGGSLYPTSPETIKKRLHYVKMKGNELFKVAIRCMTSVSKEVLKEAGMSTSEVDLFIPHQANQRISDAVAQRLKLLPENIYCNIDRIGNTSAGSIPIALDELDDQGKLEKGELVLITAFGGGVTWGATLFRW
jgi:3-oxoacyl-[acyl-carrier-protein] synthase-3